jgi:uncharacterized Zn-finger protein
MDNQCNICMKIFSNKYNLKKHNNKINPCILNNIFKCDICQKVFSKNQSLQKHKKYPCKKITSDEVIIEKEKTKQEEIKLKQFLMKI